MAEKRRNFIIRNHGKVERNLTLMAVLIAITISIGGLVEIIPLFTIKSTIEKVEGVRPYSPLELAGRNIYLREGCYTCHSQMIRPFRDEVLRYGPYSLAAESMFDHPFQWGSKRTGPDLARVGGKYSNAWHVQHMIDPQSVEPESVMPSYRHLMRPLKMKDVRAHLRANAAVGVPYTKAQIAAALADLYAQADPDGEHDHDGLRKRYPKAAVADFDGNPAVLTEMDAIIAYMQILGRMVNFRKYQTKDLRQ